MNNAPPYILDAQDPCSPLAVSAAKTALLLLDFHTFIVASQPHGGQPVLNTATKLRTWARKQGILIIHCLIDLKADTALHRKMAVRANQIKAKRMSITATAGPEKGTGEHEDIAAVADEYVFWRPPSHVSAFGGSYGLEAFFAEHRVESLLLAGFSSSGCVINTAKQAADKGYIVTAIADVCGDKSEEVHRVIMEKLLVGQCHVVDADVFVEAWDKTDGKGVGVVCSSSTTRMEIH
jgi:nicotinamidase-related amidase